MLTTKNINLDNLNDIFSETIFMKKNKKTRFIK